MLHENFLCNANGNDEANDKSPHSVASNMGLPCVQMSLLCNARHKRLRTRVSHVLEINIGTHRKGHNHGPNWTLWTSKS